MFHFIGLQNFLGSLWIFFLAMLIATYSPHSPHSTHIPTTIHHHFGK